MVDQRRDADEYPAWMGALANEADYRGDEFPAARISPVDPAIDTFRERYAPFSTDPRDRLLPQPKPRGFPVQPGYQERYGDPSKVISQVAPGSLAAQDRIVPPPQTPAEEMRRKELGALHGVFVEPVQQALNIGKMTPQEQEDLAFNAATNLLPIGKAAAVTAGFGVGARGVLESLRMGELAKPFYSAAEQAVTSAKQAQAPGAQWLGTLRNAPGVKPGELAQLGIEPWLQQQQGTVPKQAVADYVAANKVNVGEVTKSAGPQPTKFSQWQLPGGENYRETLLTLPEGGPVVSRLKEIQRRLGEINEQPAAVHQGPEGPKLLAEFDALQSEKAQLRHQIPQTFTAGHFDEPNVVAHYRTNDRDIGGKKTLFLEEVQSDWHQKGRKQGYAGPDIEQRKQALGDQLNALATQFQNAPIEQRGTISEQMNVLHDQVTALRRGEAVPDAPFKTTWHELALKRAIRDAAEGGYDQIAWTPGSVQADRYDLSKHIKDITLHGTGDNLRLSATDLHGRKVIDMKHTTREGLSDIIGKEPAEKLLAQPEPDLKNPYAARNLFDADLKVGGEGMKGFYDKMLPAAANKLGKPHGAQVGQEQMQTNPMGWHITPPDQTTHGQWMVKSSDYNSRGFRFSTKEQAEANLAQQIAGERRGAHTVHTLPITPSLREQALRKGFPMFVVGGAAGIGGLAAQDQYPR